MGLAQLSWAKYRLNFAFKARTSREELTYKDTWFLKVIDTEQPEVAGIGECAHFPGLSSEPTDAFEDKLREMCRAINCGQKVDISRWPALKMGLETAMLDLENGGRRIIVDTPFAQGRSELTINGLIWMGSFKEMSRRLDQKLEQGFTCIKLKIGGIRPDEEIRLLDELRLKRGPDVLTIRLDANGAFTPSNAEQRLEQLARFDVHSIEQPIRAGQWQQMSRLCEVSPIPIALDEELIGIHDIQERRRMLYYIAPQYIVIKPSLHGGLSGTAEWIHVADEKRIGWWITSALESNIGLNAIAQFTASLLPDNSRACQGLGTGALYTNNVLSPLTLEGEHLRINPDGEWQLPDLQWETPK